MDFLKLYVDLDSYQRICEKGHCLYKTLQRLRGRHARLTIMFFLLWRRNNFCCRSSPSSFIIHAVHPFSFAFKTVKPLSPLFFALILNTYIHVHYIQEIILQRDTIALYRLYVYIQKNKESPITVSQRPESPWPKL